VTGRQKRPKPLPKDPANPSAQFGRTYPKEVYTSDELRELLAQTSGRSPTAIRNHALISVLWQAGLRISEALELRPGDFDLDGAQIHVRHGKGGKARRVTAGPGAVESTRHWLEKRSTLNVWAETPLFCTLNGGRIYSTYVRQMLNRLARDAGWTKRVHPHGFRHTFAVNLARNGIPPAFIQRQLGHESLATTSIYLAGISTEDVAEAMAKVEWN
jgi:site-specific recombinase XerD